MYILYIELNMDRAISKINLACELPLSYLGITFGHPYMIMKLL